MDFFPIFLRVAERRVIVSGGGEAAVAKLRLLLKTTAHVEVYSVDPHAEIIGWATAGLLSVIPRAVETQDVRDARLVYAANEDAVEDARVAALAVDSAVLCNIVDNLQDSAFLTPALVDRDPLVVAIGTEGAAPVLARKVKAHLEARLPATLGALVRAARAFRPAAEALPPGARRRSFWSAVFADAFSLGAEPAPDELDRLLAEHLGEAQPKGRVIFVGAGPGDPDDLTIRARRALDTADVVIHDRLVPGPILELARREAIIIEAGKTGFGASTPQDAINRLIVEHARAGACVVRLKSGDPAVFGRLDEEIDICDAEGIDWSIVPGLTSASAAAAALGQSLTKRERNSELRLLTGHDVDGLADHDWAALARPGTVAAIYMGKRAARYIQGRLLMHGADPATPVSVVENAGRPDQRIIPARLATLEPYLTAAGLSGPALIMLGLAPRNAAPARLPVAEAAS